MRTYQFLTIAIALFVIACSSSKPASTGVWVNQEKIQGKKFQNILVIVLTADIEARVRVEGDLVNAAVARGFKAIKSVDVLPFDIKNPTTPSKQEVVDRVKGSGCDAVFIGSLLKEDEAVRYVPGKTSYTLMPYYNWTGNYYGYYSNIQNVVSAPSYYAVNKSYFMLSNLYDVATEEIMWSVQSEVFNPSSLSTFSRSYTNTLFKQLEKEKMLKR
jgi:hypothetical protein